MKFKQRLRTRGYQKTVLERSLPGGQLVHQVSHKGKKKLFQVAIRMCYLNSTGLFDSL